MNAVARMRAVQPSRRFCFRVCMNFINAIELKINTHSTTNITMLLVGLGTFSHFLAISLRPYPK
jgi:hypothetical protein